MPGRLHFVLSNVAWLKRVPMDFGGTSLAYSYAMSGVFGGLVTVSLPASSWTQSPLRESGLAATLGQQAACSSGSFEIAIWKHQERLNQFKIEPWAMTKLIDHGMSPGAAMAFLVSGSVVSIWGAIAIFPVLRARPFLLYLLLAITGSMAAGWVYDAIT